MLVNIGIMEVFQRIVSLEVPDGASDEEKGEIKMRTRDGYDIICEKQYWYVDVVGRLFHSIEVYHTYIDMVDCTSGVVIIFGSFYPKLIKQIVKKNICCTSDHMFKSEINARNYLISQIQEENNRLARIIAANHGTLANIDTTVGNLSSTKDHPRKMYAWFSQKAFDFCGGCIYRDVYGREILITCVHEHPVYDSYKWEDRVFLGEVTDFVGCVNRRQW